MTLHIISGNGKQETVQVDVLVPQAFRESENAAGKAAAHCHHLLPSVQPDLHPVAVLLRNGLAKPGFQVAAGSDTIFFPEHFGKIQGIVETAQRGDVRNGADTGVGIADQ